jgi:hypothetical protein
VDSLIYIICYITHPFIHPFTMSSSSAWRDNNDNNNDLLDLNEAMRSLNLDDLELDFMEETNITSDNTEADVEEQHYASAVAAAEEGEGSGWLEHEMDRSSSSSSSCYTSEDPPRATNHTEPLSESQHSSRQGRRRQAICATTMPASAPQLDPLHNSSFHSTYSVEQEDLVVPSSISFPCLSSSSHHNDSNHSTSSSSVSPPNAEPDLEAQQQPQPSSSSSSSSPAPSDTDTSMKPHGGDGTAMDAQLARQMACQEFVNSRRLPIFSRSLFPNRRGSISVTRHAQLATQQRRSLLRQDPSLGTLTEQAAERGSDNVEKLTVAVTVDQEESMTTATGDKNVHTNSNSNGICDGHGSKPRIALVGRQSSSNISGISFFMDEEEEEKKEEEGSSSSASSKNRIPRTIQEEPPLCCKCQDIFGRRCTKTVIYSVLFTACLMLIVIVVVTILLVGGGSSDNDVDFTFFTQTTPTAAPIASLAPTTALEEEVDYDDDKVFSMPPPLTEADTGNATDTNHTLVAPTDATESLPLVSDQDNENMEVNANDKNDLDSIPTIEWTTSEEQFVYGLLPEYTQAVLNSGEKASPQYRAFQWMAQHPRLQQIETPRILQLFALVTFYHAFQGDEWAIKRQHWLQYEINECQWGDPGTVNYLGNACHDNGHFKALNLDWFLGFGMPNLPKGIQGPSRMPPEIALLTQLEQLGLDNCGVQATLEDMIPTQIGALTNLKRLSFKLNKIEGTIPSHIGLVTSLQELSLGLNSIQGTIPSEMGNLSHMSRLFFYGNNLGGTLPTQLGQLQSLEGFSAIGNGLQGTIPTQFSKLTLLEWLYLDNNELQGSIPSGLCAVSSLTDIMVDCTIRYDPACQEKVDCL